MKGYRSRVVIWRGGQLYAFVGGEDWSVGELGLAGGGTARRADVIVATRGWPGPLVVWVLEARAAGSAWLELGAQRLELVEAGAPWQRLGEVDVRPGFMQLAAVALGMEQEGGTAAPCAAVLLTSDREFSPEEPVAIRTRDDLSARFSDPSGRSAIEPAVVEAGQGTTLRMTLTVGAGGLTEGGGMRASVMAPNWPEPRLDDPAAAGYVTVTASRRIRPPRLETSADQNFPRERWISVEADERFEAGDTVTVTYGDTSGGGPGIAVPAIPFRYERTHKYAWYHHLPPLTVWVDAKGTGSWAPLAKGHGHSLEVLPTAPARVRVTIPSDTVVDESFRVHAVVLDRYDFPLRRDLVERVTIVEDGVGGEAEWKQGEAGPGEGRMESPAHYLGGMFRSAGTRRLRVRATLADGKVLEAESNPSRCVTDGAGIERIWWGEIHAHSEYSDGVRPIEHLFHHAREAAALDFCAASDHSVYLTETWWEHTQRLTADYSDPGRFVTLVGYETGDSPRPDAEGHTRPTSGHRCIYTSGDRLPLVAVGLEAIYGASRARGDLLSIPHHTLATTRGFAPDHPEEERLVEVYSQWGSSEYRGNTRRPMLHLGRTEDNAGMSVRDLLATGARLGFIAGSDNHDARPGLTADGAWLKGIYPNMGHRGGLAAVAAPALERGSVFEALRERRCYATTGERILLELSVDGTAMGQSARAGSSTAPRRVACWAAGTAAVTAVVVVRDGDEVRRFTPGEAELEMIGGDAREVRLRWMDEAPLAPALESGGAHYYYVRVEQEDGNMAWSSPVWLEG